MSFTVHSTSQYEPVALALLHNRSRIQKKVLWSGGNFGEAFVLDDQPSDRTFKQSYVDMVLQFARTGMITGAQPAGSDMASYIANVIHGDDAVTLDAGSNFRQSHCNFWSVNGMDSQYWKN